MERKFVVIQAFTGIHVLHSLDYARLLPRAFQANSFAVVRFGILPPQSGLRRNDGNPEGP